MHVAQETRASAALARDVAAAMTHGAATLCAAAKETQERTLRLLRQAGRGRNLPAQRQRSP